MFVFITTDAFDVKSRQSAALIQGNQDTKSGTAYTAAVRRPYRGIQIKEDRYATLSIYDASGNPLFMKSESAITYQKSPSEGPEPADGIGRVADYADFILQKIDDQRMEKQQIVETFGEPFVYFFGERPRMVTFSGVLICSEDFNWRSQFWDNYDKMLRGTKLVQANARAYLSFDSIVIEGYPVSASAVDDSNSPAVVPFTMSMFLTEYHDFSSVGSTKFPQKETKNYEILNLELSETRGKFVSTTAAVRTKNLFASPAGGLLSTLRKGIKAVNSVVAMGTGFLQSVSTALSGRVVRVPAGVAGFYQNAGRAVVAGGSIDASLGMLFDGKTGQFKNLGGSVKLMMAGPGKFGPQWTPPGGRAGVFSDNTDEYPMYDSVLQSASLRDHFQYEKTGQFVDLTSRSVQRLASQKSDQLFLASLESSGSILNTVAEVVQTINTGMGLLATAESFSKDPLGPAKAAAGMVVGTASGVAKRASIIADRAANITHNLNPLNVVADELNKRGQPDLAAKFASMGLITDTSMGLNTGAYVGAKVSDSFASVANKFQDAVYPNTQPEDVNKTMGEALGSMFEPWKKKTDATTGTVASTGAGADQKSIAYDPVFGSNQYNAGVLGQDVMTQVEELNGDVDVTPVTLTSSSGQDDVSPDSLRRVYGDSAVTNILRSGVAKVTDLQTSVLSDYSSRAVDDVAGIRGIANDDADIDPVV